MNVDDNWAKSLESARLAAIVSGSSDAIVSKNLNGIINSWNASAERIFGYTADEMIGRSILTIIPPELHSEEAEILRRIRNGERLEHFDTVRLRKDGTKVHVSLTVSPLRDHEGKIAGASKIARDITDRKRAEELQGVLVNELNHRTKNLLATVGTIARRTLSGVAPAEKLAEFDRRIRALTISQDLLVRNDWHGAPLRGMVEAVLEPFATDKQRLVILGGSEVVLSLRQTNVLSLAIHELATNAMKYGALATDRGRVELSWSTANGEATLLWQERDGPPVALPTRTGFGTQIIEKVLRHELGATIDLNYEKAGVRCSIRFPL
jgi:PAS domain S-box-containing protein